MPGRQTGRRSLKVPRCHWNTGISALYGTAEEREACLMFANEGKELEVESAEAVELDG